MSESLNSKEQREFKGENLNEDAKCELPPWGSPQEVELACPGLHGTSLFSLCCQARALSRQVVMWGLCPQCSPEPPDMHETRASAQLCRLVWLSVWKNRMFLSHFISTTQKRRVKERGNTFCPRLPASLWHPSSCKASLISKSWMEVRSPWQSRCQVCPYSSLLGVCKRVAMWQWILLLDAQIIIVGPSARDSKKWSLLASPAGWVSLIDWGLCRPEEEDGKD